MRFELTTSSMPFKKYQSVTGILTENKRVSGRRFGRQWTPRGDGRASGLRADSEEWLDVVGRLANMKPNRFRVLSHVLKLSGHRPNDLGVGAHDFGAAGMILDDDPG